MMMFSRTLSRSLRAAGFVVALAAAAPAFAQQNSAAPITPTHITVATEVLRASGLMTMFDNATPNVIGSLRANITRTRPELTKDIEESLKLVEKQIPEALNEGITGAARFLAVRMSEAELGQVKTFLTSPVGKKYVEALPPFMEEVVPFLEKWNQETGARLMRTFGDEMKKRGHTL